MAMEPHKKPQKAITTPKTYCEHNYGKGDVQIPLHWTLLLHCMIPTAIAGLFSARCKIQDGPTLTWPASQACEVFTQWLQGLPFQGPKCLQSLKCSVLNPGANSSFTSRCHGCLAWCGKQLCWKTPNLTRGKPLVSQHLQCSSARAHFNLSPAAAPAVDATFPPNGKLMVCFWFPLMERHPQAESMEKFNPRWSHRMF